MGKTIELKAQKTDKTTKKDLAKGKLVHSSSISHALECEKLFKLYSYRIIDETQFVSALKNEADFLLAQWEK
jgi:hypothetical protein